MPEEICKHEQETTELLLDFSPSAYGASRTRYEVYACCECGRLLNYRKIGEVAMTPTEIMQMFVDLRAHLIGDADEAQAQMKALYEKLDRQLLDSMPKVKK
jgi:hypothetical protein